MSNDEKGLTVCPHAVSLLDKSDPRSLVNLLPDKMAQSLESAYQEEPGLFVMSERVLYLELKNSKRQPSITDNRLRLKFWNEYDRIQALGQKEINVTNVLAGVCSKQFFYDKYLSKPENVAWLMCIPANYQVVMEEALQFGLEQMRDILELEHVDPVTKKVNTKLLELKAKITEMIHVRVKGAVVQKNLNVNATPAQAAKMAENLTMEEIERRMADIEKRKKKAVNGGGSEKVVEAEIVPD
jgi:hypothetical protein